jgi:hypothetical protein
MVARVALDPQQHVSEASVRAREVDISVPPMLLDHALGSRPRLDAIREDPELEALHARWAQLYGGPPPERPGLLSRVRSRARAGIQALLGRSQSSDNALLGGLIRMTDVLVARCDELSTRMSDLEAVLEDAITVVGDDLVRIRAALAGGAAPLPPDSAGSDPSGPPRGATSRSDTEDA